MSQEYNHIPIQQLLDYVKGNLNPEEIDRLDDFLLNDNDSYEVLMKLEALNAEGKLDKFLENLDQHFLAKMNVNSLQVELTTERSTSNNYLKLAIAASVSLILLTSMFWYYMQLEDDWFNKYYEPYWVVSTTRGSQQIDNELRDKVYTLYQKGDYEGVVSAFKEVNKELLSPKDKLVYANAYLAKNNLEYAEELLLDLVQQHEDQQVYFHANWYLGLVYLAQDKEAKAEHFIREAQKDPTYKRKATSILEQIQD